MGKIIVPVVLCGGSGVRLWPLSRKQSPKQFLQLLSGKSLFDQTVGRCKTVCPAVTPLFITTQEYKFLVKDALGALGVQGDILVEPTGRNTAAALCVAALWIQQNYDDALMLVLPSDQIIADEEAFGECIQRCVTTALEGGWVLVGAKAKTPTEKYGYILPQSAGNANCSLFEVGGFIEKPDIELARELVADGWVWHAGISLVSPKKLLDEIDRSVPLVKSACDLAIKGIENAGGFIFLPNAAYACVPSLQIDKRVLEQASDIFVVLFDSAWRDVGSFDEMEQLAEDMGDGNRACGDVVLESAKRTYVRSPHRLTVAVGVEDLNIIDTKDALLITKKGCDRELNAVLETLQAMDRPEMKFHQRVARPWGHYDVITETPFYKVKCILVRPGCAISKQFHNHRAEHWVVVKGTATITRDEEEFELGVDESTFIPQGTVHRLENRSTKPLELVEVQTGSKLCEDDIVRLDDDYGRV